ncbi:cytidylyltransferase domain-containing protein [Paenibacillus chibensis]|uniref:acylneuraminate cytidylyltransferase family protein n=1 Tax=Paenibacillus chibensis TaxID=59846 RepID=UPI000FDBE9DF|nr:acylneuraminate cytidylyltransferase family protein [Paenibacillus chibensis]MEC0370796.1 acylneuraminate cytidylyltransferase family protein [Paenibacillus chibensis]
MKEIQGLLAVIPARGGSKGIPHKNMRLLNGRPMIQYTIEAALQAKSIEKVLVSTDDSEIFEICSRLGAWLPFLRPDFLSTDHAKTIDVLKHATIEAERLLGKKLEHIMLLQPTSPLRNKKDIEAALQIYMENEADSLQSVSPSLVHPYLLRTIKNNILAPLLEQNDPNQRRQDLADIYQLNGAIYIVKRDLLMEHNTIVGNNNAAYVMPKERSIDIDDMYDFYLTECLLRYEENSLY